MIGNLFQFPIMHPEDLLWKWPWIDHKPERAHGVGAQTGVSNWFNAHKLHLGSLPGWLEIQNMAYSRIQN